MAHADAEYPHLNPLPFKGEAEDTIAELLPHGKAGRS